MHRLRHRRDFRAVFQQGARFASPHLVLRALAHVSDVGDSSPGGEAAIAPLCPPATCIGISVSQKVNKRAVVRNRIKRQLKAAFRQLLPDINSGWRLAIVVKPSATQCDYHQFLQELKQLLEDAEVLNGHSRGSLL